MIDLSTYLAALSVGMSLLELVREIIKMIEWLQAATHTGRICNGRDAARKMETNS